MTCNVAHCGSPKYARGLCQRHYLRWWPGQPPERKSAEVTPRPRLTYWRGGKAA